MPKSKDAAAEIAAGRSNCAQAVFGAYAGELGIPQPTASKIAQGLGAGMGRSGSMCGAVTASALVIGMKVPDSADERSRREQVYGLVKEFIKRFTARHGSTNCTDLLGCDLSTPEGLAAARKQDVFAGKCPGLVASAVTIIEELFNNNP